MLRAHGWGEDFAPLPRRPRLGRPRWRLLAITGLAVVVVGFLAGLTGTRGGLTAIVLAVTVVVLLGVHHASGRHWLRVAAEYAVVAVLVVLLAGHFSATTTVVQHPAKPKPLPSAAALGDGCPPVSKPLAWLDCLRRQADQQTRKDASTKGGHR